MVRLLLVSLTISAHALAKPYPPELPREFRAAWVATVYNIDWPTKAGLAPEAQRKELIELFDTSAQTGLNAIILQVRPAADALYQSTYEPWSPYLTGEMGLDPGYDPLEFAIEEAHRKGLELHAWFNPFRAQTNHKNKVSSNHIVNTRPDWIKRYGNYLWLDPGNPEARRYSLQVMLDVVERYDIDGVHMDDYFYPYPHPTNDKPLPFPDLDSFERFGHGKLDKWRRSNIDSFVKDLYQEVRKTKPWVDVGISPFGIWKPGVPKGTEASLDAYSLLYADARKWLRKGWVDYMMPQLYWSIDSKGQSFQKLLNWWVGENAKGRHVWPGIATDRVGDQRHAAEIANQISLIRNVNRGYPGHSHWSADSVVSNQRGVRKLLVRTTYQSPALTPPNRWQKAKEPEAPTFVLTPTGETLSLRIAPQDDIRFWVIQSKIDEGWSTSVIDSKVQKLSVKPAEAIAVSALGLTGILSKPAIYSE